MFEKCGFCFKAPSPSMVSLTHLQIADKAGALFYFHAHLLFDLCSGL